MRYTAAAAEMINSCILLHQTCRAELLYVTIIAELTYQHAALHASAGLNRRCACIVLYTACGTMSRVQALNTRAWQAYSCCCLLPALSACKAPAAGLMLSAPICLLKRLKACVLASPTSLGQVWCSLSRCCTRASALFSGRPWLCCRCMAAIAAAESVAAVAPCINQSLIDEGHVTQGPGQ